MQNGKGDDYRKVDRDKWDNGWDFIVWNKDKPKQDKKDKEQKDAKEK